MTLTLEFFPPLQNFYQTLTLAITFEWLLLVLYMYIPCNKTFSTVPTIWTSSLTYFFKVLSLDITTRVFIFHMVIPCDKSGTRPFMESTFQHMTMFSSNPFSNQLNESQSMACTRFNSDMWFSLVYYVMLTWSSEKNSTASLLVFYKA